MFQINFEGGDYRCERQLIDDAHYMPIECLRKIRLLLEDFPKNHNLILIAHP